MGERLERVRGLLGLAGAIVAGRARSRLPRRLALSVLGVAFAVALFVTVAGVGVGLADQGTVLGSNVDYWIVPESESSSTLPVSVGGPQFGSVHPVAERLTARSDVAFASPVLLSLVSVSSGGESEYVLVAGVVAHDDLEVAGVSASNLTAGDPHYANGAYDGEWTGEVVVSTGAAELLNATSGDTLTVPDRTADGSGARNFTVAGVSEGGASGVGQFPVALVHLSELQTLTGADGGDTADQFLVATTSRGVKAELAGIYDHSNVVSRSGSSLGTVANSELALALAAAGLLVAVVVGALFVATTMGLEVTTDRRLWATLAAVGFSSRSRALLFGAQTVVVTAAGGVLGVALGWLGTLAANAAVASLFDETTVAVFSAELAAAGFALALLVGLLTAPYLVWLVGRGDLTEALAT